MESAKRSYHKGNDITCLNITELAQQKANSVKIETPQLKDHIHNLLKDYVLSESNLDNYEDFEGDLSIEVRKRFNNDGIKLGFKFQLGRNFIGRKFRGDLSKVKIVLLRKDHSSRITVSINHFGEVSFPEIDSENNYHIIVAY
ncbi:hypothetical protein A9Q91_03015 [Candidatus Gracilibacteria bacterium 28_42_T64]|nr:hypothetical protein A9Q91_03015 [Candidatus Gracilibacteria bacterium 28_42_T64]